MLRRPDANNNASPRAGLEKFSITVASGSTVGVLNEPRPRKIVLLPEPDVPTINTIPSVGKSGMVIAGSW
jgi:hypothetical protein